MKIFDATISGECVYTEQTDGDKEAQENEAKQYFLGLDLTAEEYSEPESFPAHSIFVMDIATGIDMYYNYGADYYFIVIED